MHCVHAHTRCIIRLSESTLPLVRTFAMLAISPNASKRTDRLDASSKRYSIPVSNFSMVGNCFMGCSFPGCLSRTKRGWYNAIHWFLENMLKDTDDRCGVKIIKGV